jgi:hypothetical protein
MIKGTVTDTSPGTEEYALTTRFPNGVPAVSDESMSDWMQYVYMQFPRPTNTNGVPVNIDVIDSNGNYRNIGTTNSDASGTFSYAWKPDISGSYTVIASFAGSKAYYPSSAETAFVIDETATTPAPTAMQVTSMSDMYFIPAIVGLFIFVAVLSAVTILTLRKRA